MGEQVLPWSVIAGRCGACRKFVKDFGNDAEAVYGHCGIKPRTGAITSESFKCDVYVPVAEVASDDQRSHAEIRLDRARAANQSFDRKRTVRSAPAPRTQAPMVRKKLREARDKEPVEWGDLEMDVGSLRQLIREAIDDGLGLEEVELVDRFQGGTIEIKPGDDDTQPKSIPIDNLMRKIVMIRDNLRVLEQKVNTHSKLDDADRIQLQQYVTRCYGSLTSFNFLFKHREDNFRGSGS
jgi:hypothetical protein